MTTRPHTLDVAIAGFGTVGRAVARLLSERRHPVLRLRAICTRRAAAARSEAPWVPSGVCWTDDFETLLNTGAGVVVELVGGVEPARTWIDGALRAGRSVVTANKQVMAEHGPELVSLARACGSSLRFEAAVGGAVPVIRGMQEGLAGDRLTRIFGVVNGTCNFVLSRMMRGGVSMADAVCEAQACGLAEADPGADLDGVDARAKLAILATIGFGDHLQPRDIPTGSIRQIDSADLSAAASIGRVVRQVAWADRSSEGEGRIDAGVGAALVCQDSWLARARGPENVVCVRGERSGTTVFAGQGAGGDATAVAVVSDLLALLDGRSVPRPWPAPSAGRTCADFVARHYVRVLSADASGTHDAAGTLARAGIAIDRVLDQPGNGGRRWAAVVHPCSHRDLIMALETLVPAASAGASAVGLPLLDGE
jgi:homoserine dehydrogenase